MIVTKQNIPSAIEKISQAVELSLDTETTGLKSFHGDKLFSIIISTDQEDFYFNFQEYPDVEVLNLAEVADLLRPILEDHSKVWYLQNAKFDMHMLANEGLVIRGKIYDLMFLDRSYDNSSKSYRLSDISTRWGEAKDDRVWDYIQEHKLLTKKEYPHLGKSEELPHFNQVPFNLISEYGKQDGKVTLSVGKKILHGIKEKDREITDGTPKQMVVVENEARLVHTLFKMEQSGIKIDKDYCQEALIHYKTALAASEIKFKELTGIDFVKGTLAFEEAFAAEPEKWQKTATGAWCWDANVLETFENPAAKVVLEYSEAKKNSEYFANFLFYADANGVVHPSFKQSGTVTSRFSCRDPNLQNLTSPDKYDVEEETSKFLVRQAFVPREGYFFAMIDYAQSEFRMFLEYARANALIREVLLGKDVHTATSQLASVTRKEAKACIAEGSLVLTSMGLKPIEAVSIEDKLWDGVEWIEHDGVIFKGYRDTIIYDGLEATEDHNVFTEKGWKICFGDYTKEQNFGRLMVTEVGGTPIRYPYDCIKVFSKNIWAARGKIQMLNMFKNISDIFRKYSVFKNKNLQVYDFSRSEFFKLRSRCGLFIKSTFFCYETTLYQPEVEVFSKLWWARDSDENNSIGMGESFSNKLYKKRNNVEGNRSDKQRGGLRNWQYTLIYLCREFKEYAEECFLYLRRGKNNLLHFVEIYVKGLPPLQIKQRENNKTGLFTNPAGRNLEKKSKRPVYDILNAGPRNRFTVSGKLVANCNFLTVYSGGVAKLTKQLYKTMGNDLQVSAIYKHMLNWNITPEEKVIYKATPKHIIDNDTILINKAWDIQKSIFRASPEIKDTIKRVQKVAELRGFIRNFYGRRYQFPDKRFAYKAANHLIQGTCADMLKFAMNRIDELLIGKKTRMLLTIHDELVFEVYYSEEYLLEEIKKIMEEAYPYRALPQVAEISYSKESLAQKNLWV